MAKKINNRLDGLMREFIEDSNPEKEKLLKDEMTKISEKEKIDFLRNGVTEFILQYIKIFPDDLVLFYEHVKKDNLHEFIVKYATQEEKCLFFQKAKPKKIIDFFKAYRHEPYLAYIKSKNERQAPQEDQELASKYEETIAINPDEADTTVTTKIKHLNIPIATDKDLDMFLDVAPEETYLFYFDKIGNEKYLEFLNRATPEQIAKFVSFLNNKYFANLAIHEQYPTYIKRAKLYLEATAARVHFTYLNGYQSMVDRFCRDVEPKYVKLTDLVIYILCKVFDAEGMHVAVDPKYAGLGDLVEVRKAIDEIKNAVTSKDISKDDLPGFVFSVINFHLKPYIMSHPQELDVGELQAKLGEQAHRGERKIPEMSKVEKVHPYKQKIMLSKTTLDEIECKLAEDGYKAGLHAKSVQGIPNLTAKNAEGREFVGLSYSEHFDEAYLVGASSMDLDGAFIKRYQNLMNDTNNEISKQLVDLDLADRIEQAETIEELEQIDAEIQDLLKKYLLRKASVSLNPSKFYDAATQKHLGEGIKKYIEKNKVEISDGIETESGEVSIADTLDTTCQSSAEDILVQSDSPEDAMSQALNAAYKYLTGNKNTLERRQKILKYISSRGKEVSKVEIARMFNLSTTTVGEDMKAIEEALRAFAKDKQIKIED